MKIIEALKQIKDLERKANDLVVKVQKNSAYLSHETPAYTDQKEQVHQWVQAHSDILKEILRLKIAIQKTNLETDVTIELAGKTITKSIAEWIHRRRDLAAAEQHMWSQLTDRGLKEGQLQQSVGDPIIVKIVRCFDPAERDKKIDAYMSEPVLVDSRLEIINAVTDLIE